MEIVFVAMHVYMHAWYKRQGATSPSRPPAAGRHQGPGDRQGAGGRRVDAVAVGQKQGRRVAGVRGLHRVIIPLPVLTPRLAALWVGLVTPIPNSLAIPLVEGIMYPVIGDPSRARRLFPDIHPIPYREAVRQAL